MSKELLSTEHPRSLSAYTISALPCCPLLLKCKFLLLRDTKRYETGLSAPPGLKTPAQFRHEPQIPTAGPGTKLGPAAASPGKQHKAAFMHHTQPGRG